MRRRRILRGWPAAAAPLAILAVVGCSAPGQSPAAVATPGGTASPSAVAPASPSGSSGAGPSTGTGPSGASKTSGAIADPGGDADAGYLDITRLSARATAGRLELSLVLAAAIPASTVTVGTVRYDFGLDTNGDGVADFVASLENVPEGGYRPALTDSATGRRLEGPDFPGKAASNGGEVTLTLDLAAVGCPKTAAIRASSSRTRAGVTAGDEAPDAGSATVSLSTGC